MLIGFSNHGRGSGDRAVAYLTSGMDDPGIQYLTGTSSKGKKRATPPVIVRGDPKLTQRLLREVPFERRYTSGVLSFEEKSIDPVTEGKIIDRFEAAAFAGIPAESRNMLWVRHTDKGRHEIHFIHPAIELRTAKNLNINPPRESTREMFDTLRTLVNDDYGFSRPDDPARAQAIRIPAYESPAANGREQLRKSVTAYLSAQQKMGLVSNRTDILQSLRNVGFKISRVGRDYITVADASGTRCRLKGALVSNQAKPSPFDPNGRLCPEDRSRLETRLSELVAARAAYNEKRFAVPEPEPLLPPPGTSKPEPDNPPFDYDRARTLFGELVTGLEQRCDEPRSPDRGTLDRIRNGTLTWRGAVADLSRASKRAFRATGEIARSLPYLVSQIGGRSADLEIFEKYGVSMPSEAAPEKACEVELEPDFDEDTF